MLVAWGDLAVAPEANAQDVTIQLEPDYIESQVGDSVYRWVTIENHHCWFVTVTGYAGLTLANGRFIHRDAPGTVALPPFFSYTLEVFFEIELRFRSGEYILRVCATRPEGQIADCDSSRLVVLPGQDSPGSLTEVEFKGFLF